MLIEFIRRGQESFLIKAFLLLIAASFFIGFLVLPAARRGSAEDIVAVVGGENVYRREVANAIVNLRARYREQAGEAYTQMRDYFEERIPQQAWEQLIGNRRAEVYAQQMGFATSPEEMRRVIVENESFQVDGKFSKKLYLRYLDRIRKTEGQFEDDLAKELTLQKVKGLLASQVKVSEAELQQRYYDEQVKVELEVFVLDPADLKDTIQPTDEEIQKYYSEHTVDFFQPERRELVYFIYDGGNAQFLGLPEVQVSDDDPEIRKYYERESEQFTLKEKNWRVQDILFATKPTGEDDKRSDDERKKAARAKAEEALGKLQSGIPFEEVANQYSDDAANQRMKNGGLIAGGFVTAGYYKKQVFDVFSTLEEGKNSDIFEAPDGLHIVKVAKIYEAGTVKPLADVINVVKTSLRQERASAAAEKRAKADLDAVGGQSLRDFALADVENRRLEVAVVSREEPLPNVGKDPELMDKIFNELTPDSRPVLLKSNKRWILIHVEKVHPPEAAPLSEKRDEIVKILKENKAEDAARERAQEIRKEVLAGASGARLLKKYKNLVVEDVGPFTRIGRESGGDGSGVDVIPKVGASAQMKAAVFTLTKENPVTPDVYLAGKKIAFARLKKRTEVDPSGYAIARDALERKIQQERQNRLYSDWLKQAEEHVKVEIRTPIEEIAKSLGPVS